MLQDHISSKFNDLRKKASHQPQPTDFVQKGARPVAAILLSIVHNSIYVHSCSLVQIENRPKTRHCVIPASDSILF